MTTIPVSHDDLVEVREELILSINKTLTDNERKFLISFKSGNPDWNLFPIQGIKDFPAIRWKQMNIKKKLNIKNINLCSIN